MSGRLHFLSWSCMLVACGGGGSSPPTDGIPGDSACDPPTVIYLNRVGGTYTSGAVDDSSNNVSSVIGPVSSITVGAPGGDFTEADWLEVRACIEDRFAPFDVAFTETDPGAAEHQELLVLTDGNEIGDPNAFSRSPTIACDANDQPQPVPRGITLLVWRNFTIDPNLSRCLTAAHAIALTLGLDRSLFCPDLMSLLDNCGEAKTFTNTQAQCGETTARPCRCGGPTQNSFRYLSNLLGPACP